MTTAADRVGAVAERARGASAGTGALTTPLDALRVRARALPGAIALRELGGASWTRGALCELAEDTRAGLLAEGFAPGDRVLFSVRPGAAAVALALAVHDLGGVLVPHDPGVGDALFAARLARIAPRWVCAEGWLLLRRRSLAARALAMLGVTLAPLADVRGARVVRVGWRLPGTAAATEFDRLVRRGRDWLAAGGDAAGAAPDPEAEAMIIPTSGTTAAPRLVVHTRRSLAATLAAVARELRLREGDVLLARELHLLLPALAAGAVCVVPRALRFDPHATLDAMEHLGVTHAFLVTRDCRLLLDACRRAGRTAPATLQMLMIGAAPVRAAFLAELRAILPAGCTAWCIYGATELLPIARVSLEEKVAWAGEGDLVGAPLDGVSVRLDGTGQLIVRGDRLCRGMLGEPPIAEHATGDLARCDHGRIVLLGRAKDMIIRGEHNIYPALHEPLVERIPGVRRAAMVGDFDAALADERVVLVVEPEPGEDPARFRSRVARAIREGATRLDRAALPDRIEVRAIPESGRSHKVDKAALRAALGARSPVR